MVFDSPKNVLEYEQLANLILAWPSLPPSIKEAILSLANGVPGELCSLDYL